MADRLTSGKVWACGGTFLAVWMATSFVAAQPPEPPAEATVEVVPGGHPLVAPPKPLSEVRLHVMVDDQSALQDLAAIPTPSRAVFPSSPFVANAHGWHADCPYGRYYILCHDPLYTEDIPLERYGCALPCGAQEVCSVVKYFGTIPLMPIKYVGHCWNRNGWCRDYMGQLRPGCGECGCCKPWWCDTGCCPQQSCDGGACQIGCATH